MKKILILFAHPALEKSRVQRAMVEAVRDLAGVTFHDLYEAYPDFLIDVPFEQKLLSENEIIVLQHPFFWYSTPAILKEWQDLVLQHGWAFGTGGTALHGKLFLNAMSAGGKEEAYRRDGLNRFTVRELLAPLEQTASLCGMKYLPPFVVHGTHSVSEKDIAKHAQRYREHLLSLCDGDENAR